MSEPGRGIVIGWIAPCVFLLGLATPGHWIRAQEVDAQRRVAVGARIGLSLSTLRFQDPSANDQTEIKAGIHVGVGAAFPLGRHLEAAAGIGYSQGGFRGRGGHPATLTLGSVELPLVARARARWRVAPHVTAGLVPSFRVHCGLSELGTVGKAACDDPVVGTEWDRFDIAALGGGGISFGAGSGVMMLEGLVQWGLVDLKPDPLPPGWAKSASVRISTAYRLTVGGRE